MRSALVLVSEAEDAQEEHIRLAEGDAVSLTDSNTGLEGGVQTGLLLHFAEGAIDNVLTLLEDAGWDLPDAGWATVLFHHECMLTGGNDSADANLV